ncbi:InlB B-repeat-containing protein [Candidatus Saccharibacteria bacterium]|nr:InlB B-repeat-containing protein [Candidatus Saccharibacteria bacterium]
MLRTVTQSKKWGFDVTFILVLSFLNVVYFYNINSTWADGYTLTMSHSGVQQVDVVPKNINDIATTIAEDNVTIVTTCRSGYNFAIGTSVNDNNLYLNGNSSINTAGKYFTAADGNTALSNASNTWGYYFNRTIVPSSSSVFLPVPAYGSGADILVSPTASATDISDSFSVYYGVAASGSIPAGMYKMIPDSNNNGMNNDGADGVVVYYATVAEACMSYTVEFNPTSTASGTPLSGTGTMNDQTIYKGVATNLTTNNFTPPNGYEFREWNTAQDGSGTNYADGASVTDLTTPGGTITLYAQWRAACPSNTICYDGNGADTGIGGMANQTGENGTSAMLRGYNFKRTDYAFLGWSESTNPIIGTDTIYGPMETVTFSTQKSGAANLSAKGLILYAVWIPKDTTDTMQTFSATTCNNRLTKIDYDATHGFYTHDNANYKLTADSFIALEDERDGNTYMVARLTDGNCWMLENLRLNTADSTDSTLAQGYGGVFTRLADSESNNFSNSTTANTVGGSTLYSTTNITGNNTGYRFPRYNSVNTVSPTTNVNATDANIYGYGNYYTWAAAMANTSDLTSNTSDSVGTSLCPTNWRLPLGNSTAIYSFGTLSTSMGGLSTNMTNATTPTNTVIAIRYREFPNNFVYAGFYNGAATSNRGSRARYWSSTAASGTNAYVWRFNDDSTVYPGNYSYEKYRGCSIRCVAGT